MKPAAAGRDGDEPAVPFHLPQQPVADQLPVGLACRLLGTAAVCHVERHAVMPCLLVLYGGVEAVSLLGVDVDDRRPVRVFHTAEHLDEFLHVVSLFQVSVFKSPCLEPVVPAGAVAFAQGTQILVDAAVVLGDGLVVVVQDDDEVRLHLARDVQPLECLAARHRAVADEGDDVLAASREVTRLGETRREADRGGRVPDVEKVVRALLGIRIARDLIVLLFHEIRLDAPRQHLMWVGLMRHVVDDLVRR